MGRLSLVYTREVKSSRDSYSSICTIHWTW